MYNWDRLRFLAILDIVGLHVNGQYALGGIGLPLFTIISMCLTVKTGGKYDMTTFIKKRGFRLMVPWLFWSLLYAVLKSGYSAYSGEPVLAWCKWNMIVAGTISHLWFLPFISVAGVATLYSHKITEKLPVLPLVVVTFLLGNTSMILVAHSNLEYPFYQWLFCTPAVFLGFSLGMLLIRAMPPKSNVLTLTLYAVSQTAVAILLYYVSPQCALVLKQNLIALLLILIALIIPNKNDFTINIIKRNIYGVYIVHGFLFLALLKPLYHHIQFMPNQWLNVTIIFAVTLTVVVGLRRTFIRHFL